MQRTSVIVESSLTSCWSPLCAVQGGAAPSVQKSFISSEPVELAVVLWGASRSGALRVRKEED
jgi:hypothetical protein